MPNSVYQRVYDGLAAMVSPRAASQALKNALESRGDTPDTVDTDTMIRLIKGPIFREFQLILPRDGLKRNLHGLINEPKVMQEKIEAEAEAAAAVAAAAPAPFISVGQGLPNDIDTSITLVDEDIVWDSVDPALDAGLDEIMVGEEDDLDDVSDVLLIDDESELIATDNATAATTNDNLFLIEDESREITQPAATLPQAKPPVKSSLPTTAPPLSEERIEKVTLTFAQIEQVTQVAAMRQRGEVVVSRGEGIDLTQLSRLGIMGLHLLRRSGHLRSYYLSHSKGQLFLLPVGQDIIVVAGTPSLNVGEIFSTHNSLESEIQSESVS